MSKTATPVEELTEDQLTLKKQANAPWKAPAKGEKMVKLTIHKPEGDNSDSIFVSVNFRDYQIKYGEEVIVPVDVVEGLKNTLMTTFMQDPSTEKLRTITRPRFAFNTEAA